MRIGIVVAMEKELNPLIDFFGAYEKITIMEKHIYSFSDYPNVFIVLSGIGEINASISCMLLINHYGVDRIVNYGFAGYLSADLNVGDIIRVTEVIHTDVDLTCFGNLPGQYDGANNVSFMADGTLFLKKVTKTDIVLSSDKFSDKKEYTSGLITKFGPHLTDMESAGIAVTCFLAGIPFSIVKCISNNINDSIKDYALFSETGIYDCAKCVFEMIRDLYC